MAKNRKKAEEFLLDCIQQLDPSGLNKSFYSDAFKTMSNQQFDDLAKGIREDGYVLPIFVPTAGKVKLNTERAVKLARKLGREIFQRLWLTDNITGLTYLTPKKYMVVDLPVRRMAQLLVKKMSMPSVVDTVDALTGQATGPSKGSSMSFPEIQVLASKGHNKTIEEMIKVRGGDTQAYRQFSNSVMQTGSGSLRAAGEAMGRVKSTETLRSFLLGMHLDNNL